MLGASPAVIADTNSVDDGGGDAYGDARGEGWASSCSATASASGDWPDSGAVYWASVDIWTNEAGKFRIRSSWSATASAGYDGPGASASAGGSGSAPGGSASASASVSYPGPENDYENDPYDSYVSDEIELDEGGGFSASSSCGAYASAPENGSSGSTAYGHATADVSFQ
jgi:hypothetical protein